MNMKWIIPFIVSCFILLSADEVPYERFIGLGNCCATRSHINRHLSQRFSLDAHLFGGGQLFDWLIIEDYNKLAEAIENDLFISL